MNLSTLGDTVNGQKDYRSNKGGFRYVIYISGAFVEIPKTELSKYLNSESN